MFSLKKSVYRTRRLQQILECECVGGEVTIGTQTWTCKNLDVTTYRNGDTIPQVTDPSAWANLTTGAWCYYNNDPSTEATYGKLYNWYAITDLRNLAPIGYHLPTKDEWNILIAYAGDTISGNNLKESGTTHWLSPNTSANNSLCFTGLPSGERNQSGVFSLLNQKGNWWTETPNSFSGFATSTNMSYNTTNTVVNDFSEVKNGYSVRLVKGDCACSGGEVTIGTQIWTCANADISTYRNGDIIPQVTDPTVFNSLRTGAWCYYNNDPAYASYGKLYNWYAIMDSRGFAPDGYHVPTIYEWDTLILYLGGTSVAGGKMKEYGTTHWDSPNVGGSNRSCFTALGTGALSYFGLFYNTGYQTVWWSTTEHNAGVDLVKCPAVRVYDTNASGSNDIGPEYVNQKWSGFPVRLIKD